MTKKNYFDGIRKSLSNASELFDDAEVLFKLNRLPRAYTLYQLAIEEIGKASIIYNFILRENYQDELEQRKFKKQFLSHPKKTENSIGLDVLLAFLIPNSKLKTKIIYQVYNQEKSIEKLNNLKNNSLYTNLQNGKFIAPKEIIKNKLASDIQFVAQIRLNVAKQFYKIAIENFDKLQEATKNINEEEMITNPPEEILELSKFKSSITIEKS